MRLRPLSALVVGLMLLAGFAVAVSTGGLPLGVPGEWVWSRLDESVAVGPLGWLLGAGVLGLYAGFVFGGFRGLAGPGTVPAWRRAGWLVGLGLAAVLVQTGLQCSAPEGYGLTKWTFALHSPGSNGYYTLARSRELDDPWRFLKQYPEWIKKQDTLHIGTHPPGLFLLWRGVLGFWRAHPEAAVTVSQSLPPSVQEGFREIGRYDPLPAPDRASLATVGFLTLLASSLTVVPLYFLARSRLSPEYAWAAAALWPVVPSAVLFQPAADSAYPLLSASALALAVRGRRLPALLTGLLLAVAMQMTLVFLAVGLVVAVLSLTKWQDSWVRRLELVAWTGLGFVGLTALFWLVSGANPLSIWLSNAHNHARFYDQFPRSYLVWNLVGPFEVAVAVGLPASVWAAVGFRRAGWPVWASVLVLAALQLSGRSLGEVARLWLPLMPPLLVSGACGWEKLGARAGEAALTVLLVGAQTLWLQATVQVVYALA